MARRTRDDKREWAAYMREYYASHPEYRERTRELSRARYERLKRDPNWMAKERARRRERAIRLGDGARKKNSKRFAEYQREWRKQFPEKVRAHRQLAQAIVRGDVVRPARCKYGKPKPEAHHPDYSKPLQVEWLCRRCHMYHHRNPKGRDLEYQIRRNQWV